MVSRVHSATGIRKRSRPQLREFFAAWFRKNGRPLPWRKQGTTAFGMLIAEVLLRQTRAEMVAEIWPSLMSAYPNAASLAAADADQLESHVAGLGLGRQRTEALIQLGRTLVLRFKGAVPRDVQQLEQLPHVGMYGARAVACFAFGQSVPVVDSNVVRIFSRLKGVPAVADIRRAKHIWRFARRILPSRFAKRHNYGLLDFAAAVCRSRNPLCDACPLIKNCLYFQSIHKPASIAAVTLRRIRNFPERPRKVLKNTKTVDALS